MWVRIPKCCPGNGPGRFHIFAAPGSQLFLEWGRKDTFIKDTLLLLRKQLPAVVLITIGDLKDLSMC